jgi:hypothetical protein
MYIKKIPNAETSSKQTNPALHSVLLCNRLDCCGEREESLEVLLSDDYICQNRFSQMRAAEVSINIRNAFNGLE